MKRLFVIVIFVGGIYFIKPNLFSGFFSNGAFDSNGNPVVWIFTAEKCGVYCSEVIKLLDNRNIDFTEFDANSEEGQKRLNEVGRTNSLPLIQVGSMRVAGSYKAQIISMLAEGLGEQALTRTERHIMRNHFYEGGEPMMVMYGTSWCGGCKEMRQYFEKNDIDYTEFDAEGSGREAYEVLTARGYPLLYVGYRRIEGINYQIIEKAIDDFNI